MNTEAQAPYGCKAKIIRDRAGNSVPPHRLFLPRLRIAESVTAGFHPAVALVTAFLVESNTEKR